MMRVENDVIATGRVMRPEMARVGTRSSASFTGRWSLCLRLRSSRATSG